MTAPEVNAIKDLTKAVRELTRELKPKGDNVTVFADNKEYVRFSLDDILNQEIVKTVKNVLLDYEFPTPRSGITQWDAQEIMRKFIDAGVAFVPLQSS